MNNSNLLHKLYEKVCKDTGGQNESPKLIIVVRLITLTMILYSLFNSLLFLSITHIGGMACCQLSMVLFLFVFALSYHRQTFASFCTLNVCILIWIIFNIYMFGWDIGVQHFIPTLLFFCFFAKYRHTAAKIIYAAVLCTLRIFLFFYCQSNTPVIILATEINNAFQILNTIVIFWTMSLIAYIFSTDTQSLEGKLIEYNEQLKAQANLDPLTGLYNRRRTMEYLEELLDAPAYPVSLCICDIDFFKRVNDTYGHDIGDIVLMKLAETFHKELPSNAFVSRWGGEEFLLIFPAMNGNEAKGALENLRTKIKEIVFDGGCGTFSISVTFGLAEYDFHSDLTALLKEADEKLYLGKESGRDRIVF